ncbi:MAG TPA: WXG100 family type VII secretion target [Pseudonocardiaceae bacterium]|nr:WXG100 family type VII secretion target [Pseudonocardiaceae bacterium]
MAQFTTGSSEMMQGVRSLQEMNEHLQGSLKQLQGEVETVASQWTGSAATAFQNLMMRFNEDATKLNQNLQQMSEAMAGNNQAYQTSEESNQSEMSKLLGGL